jgi:glutamyl-tRNA synthetase
LSSIGKSPAKLDMERILSINEHYIKNLDERELYKNLKVFSEKYKSKIDEKYENNLIRSISFLKNKAKKLEDIYKNAQYIINNNIKITKEDINLIDELAKKILNEFSDSYENLKKIDKENLEKIVSTLIKKYKTNFKGVGQPLRIALTGSRFGPGIYDIILSLDKEEVVKRLKIVT